MSIQTKVINSNYSSIQHLYGSKMICDDDKLLNQREQDWLTVKTRSIKDIVIVTEKVDGCNVGVLRRGNELLPIVRKGYNVLSNPLDWIKAFDNFVREREERFLNLLNDGERVCGEWLIKTHTLQYKMKHEPFVCFDLISGIQREKYLTAKSRLEANGFITAGLVHYGTAIPVNIALEMLSNGFHGVIGEPEGIVYRYEDKNGFVFCGKYVSNPLVWNTEIFKQNIDSMLMNKWK